jgi:CHAT domain-containing protein
MRPIGDRPGLRPSWVLMAVLAASVPGSSGAQAPSRGAGDPGQESRAARVERQAAYRKQMEEFARQGTSERAIEAANRFMELERELAGEDTPGMAFALKQLAEVAVRERNDAEALRHLRRAHEVERKIHGDAHWHVTDMRNEVEYVEALSKLDVQGREQAVVAPSPRSLEEIRHALVALRHSVGERTTRYALMLEQLAWTLRAAGNPFAAAVWSERSLRAFEGLVGRHHPSYVRALRLRALIHRDLEENDRAIRILDEADTLARRIPDMDARDLSLLAEARGSVLSALGRLEDAARAYAEAADLALRTGGEGSPDHVRLLADEANVARRRRDFGHARRLWDRVVAYSKARKDRDAEAYACAMVQLARTLQDQGDLDAATRLAREVRGMGNGRFALSRGRYGALIERDLAIIGEGERRSRYAEIARLADRAQELRRQHHLKEAVSVLESQIKLLGAAIDGSESDLVIHPLEDLARVHLEAGNDNGARRTRQQRFQVVRMLLGDDHWQTVDARLALGQVDRLERLNPGDRARLGEVGGLRAAGLLSASAGLLARASDDLRRARALQATLTGEEDPATLDLLGELAAVLSMDGRHVDAEEAWARALAQNRRIRGPGHPCTILAIAGLARAREARGDVRGAKEVLLQATSSKQPSAGKARPASVVLHHHANGQLATFSAGDQDILGSVPEAGDRGGLDRDLAAMRALAEAERRVLGSTHPARLESLEWLAKRHSHRHQFDGAIAARRDIVELLVERAGPDHWSTVDARANLAEVERTAVVAREDPDLLRSAEHADSQVRIDRSSSGAGGRQGESLQHTVSALILWRRVLGERAHRCVQDLEILGDSLRQQGQLDAAERVLTRVVQLRRESVGEEHPAYSQALRELGAVLLDQGRAAEAEPTLRRSVALFQAQIGKLHPLTAVALMNWGQALRAVGDLDGAQVACQDSVALLQASVGERHGACLLAVVELAGVLRLRGDYPRALTLLQAVHAHLEKAGYHATAGDPLSRCAADLASLLGAMGEFARAKVLLERLVDAQRNPRGGIARSINAGHMGQDVGEARYHPIYADRLQTLAGLLMELGDVSRAYRLSAEALKVTEEVLGPDHPAMAEREVGLARALVSLGDLDRVGELLDRAERDVTSRGERDPLRPRLLATRAAALLARNRPAEAIPMLQRALAASSHAFGEGHPESVRLLNELATILQARGESAAARSLSERGLELNRGRPWSDSSAEAALLVNLARASWSLEDLDRAREAYQQALRSLQDQVTRNLSGMGEHQRLALVERLREPFLESFDLLKGDPALDQDAYGRLIVWKGIATAVARREGSSASRDRRVFLTPGNPVLNPLGSSDPLAAMRDALARSCFERYAYSEPQGGAAGPKNPGVIWQSMLREARLHDWSAAHLGGLVEDIGAAEARGAAKGGQSQPLPDVRRVAGAVPERAVLLDFLRYAPRGGGPHYAVFVVHRGKPPRRLDLGPAAPIDRAIMAWRAAIEADSDDTDPAVELYNRLWAPVGPLCRDAEVVLVAPDGELNHLPWAALPDRSPSAAPDAFLLERHTFAQVPSARRLVEGARPAPRHLGLLAVGGIDYDRREPASDQGTLRSPWMGQLGPLASLGPALPKARPLEGTGQEIGDIQALFEATHDPSAVTIVLAGPRAARPRVKGAMPAMRYIHLATHGFFAPPEIRAALDFEDRRPAIRSPGGLTRKDVTTLYPGLLSGLMLAGVNDPQESEGSPGRLDWAAGLLTAEEVAGMDLSDCELAVLSACETGVGRVAGGEGVLGLHRAFHVAGARFVIASLWRIEDRATRRLMSEFYQNLWVRGLPVPEALRRAQLATIRGDCQPDKVRGPGRLARSEARAGKRPVPRRLHPRTWAAWVVSGVPDASAGPAERRTGRAATHGRLHSVPPGWRGGKIAPFLAVAVDEPDGAAFTTTASGQLQHYSYPDFVLEVSYKLAGPSYQAVFAGRRGSLFALVTEPGALKVGQTDGQPGGIGDLHVYDLRSRLDGQKDAGSALAPVSIIPLGANVPQMFSSRDGRSIFCLLRDSSARGPARLIRVDADACKVDCELQLPAGTEVICLTPDGSTLYAAVSTTGHTPDLSAAQEGQIVEIDASTLGVRRTVRVGHDPCDIQANDAGLVFLSGGSGQLTQVVVVSMKGTPSIVARWPGVLMGTRIHLSCDQRRLFIAPPGKPSHVESWLLPAKLSEQPLKEERLNSSPEIPVGGEIFLTPKGDFLLTRPGGIAPIRIIDG